MNFFESFAKDLEISEHIKRLDEGTLSSSAPRKISKVLAAIMPYDAFLYTFYSEFTWYDNTLPKKTAGVRPASDGKHIIFSYNEAFLEGLAFDEILFLLLHEAGHILREHHARAAAMGVDSASKHEIANICMDVWINEDIQNEGSPVLKPKPPFNVYSFTGKEKLYGPIDDWLQKTIEASTGKPFTDKFSGPHTTESLYSYVMDKLGDMVDQMQPPGPPPPKPPYVPQIGDIIAGPGGRFGVVTSVDELNKKVTGIEEVTKEEAFRRAREQAGLDKPRITGANP